MKTFKVGDVVKVIGTRHSESGGGLYYKEGMVGVVCVVSAYRAYVKFHKHQDVPQGCKDLNYVMQVGQIDLAHYGEEDVHWWETEEGKQWLSEQMDVEECFNKSQENTACSDTTYSIGQWFRVFYREDRYWDCVLAQVAPLEVCLIDIDSGNRMRDPFAVKDTNNVTTKEMKEISYGLEFVLK